jgi:16S rRNA (guanine966-N2)-methyltransferase
MSVRIISGERRGAKLRTPDGMETRPLRDRVREALFSMVRPELIGARVLDAFSGTGAIGLEALSNGAEHAVFVEPSEKALKVIEENIRKLRYEAKCTVIKGTSPEVIGKLGKGAECFDLIFMMPPYHSGLCEKVLKDEAATGRFTDNAMIVCEVNEEESFEVPEGFVIRKERSYGITRIVLLAKKA